MEWKAKGKATIPLIPTLAATGSDPNAAAIEATSKCHPRSGDAKYVAPNTYIPVIQVNVDPSNRKDGTTPRLLGNLTARENCTRNAMETTKVPSNLRLINRQMRANRTILALGSDNGPRLDRGDALGLHPSSLLRQEKGATPHQCRAGNFN